MRKVTLRELENFVALAEQGSVTGAARAIGLSQPAMSTSLRELEKALGVTLFVRHRGRGLGLLPEGEALLVEARDLLARADELQEKVSAESDGSAGRLVLGSLMTAAPIVVPSLVRRFRDLHPGVVVEIRTGVQEELLEAVESGALHAALTYDIAVHSGIRFVRLADSAPHVLMAADHPRAGAASVALDEMVDDPFVMLDLSTSREYYTSLFLAAGVSMRPSMTVTDLSLVRSLVGNGFGWSLGNLVPALDEAQDGSRLAYVPLRTDVPPLGLGLARRAGDRGPAVLDAFTTFARSSFQFPR
jgi:DNA-binding transcriptional LysR family regulator